jgi:solute carrier family 35 protein F5
MKSIFTTQHYNKPFFLTFLNTSTFALYLVPTLLRRFLLKRRRAVKENEIQRPLVQNEQMVEEDRREGLSPVQEAHSTTHGQGNAIVQETLSVPDTALLGLQFCFLWFLGSIALMMKYIFSR